MPSNPFDTYSPSEELHNLIVQMYKDRYPGAPINQAVHEMVDNAIENAVRGFLATLGRGLDAEKGQTYTMTEAGIFKDEVKKCYHYRLPVKAGDKEALYQAIADDLFKYADTQAMVLGDGKLVAQAGELVVIGLRFKKVKTKSNWVKATVYIPD